MAAAIAYKSSISVGNISKTVSSLGKGISQAQKSANNINNNLLKKTRLSRQSIANERISFVKRREAVRRREQEDIVEASGIGGAIRRQGKVIASSTKGFLGRILDFIGTMMVGWLVSNLPTIISLAQQLIKRIEKTVTIMGGFVTGVTKILSGFGSLLSETFGNLASFDFTVPADQLNLSMKKMKEGFQDIEDSIQSVINIFSEPFDFGTKEETEFPPSTGPGAGTGLPDAQSPEMYRIAAALSTEGSGRQSVVDMMQVVVNRKAMGYGKTYTAVLAGKGQFEGVEKRGTSGFLKIQTLQDASKWSGQSENALLGIIKNIQDSSLQASAAKFVGGATEFRGSPATVRAVNSDGDPRNNIQADSTGRIPGSAWRGGNGDNQFLTSNPPGAAPTTLRPGGAAPFNLPAAPPPAPGQITTAVKDEIDVSGPTGGTPSVGISDVFGYSASRGRLHAGIDIGTSGQKGWYVSLRKSGQVVFVGSSGGYGLMVDIVGPDGTCYRFAHFAKILVKVGPYNGEAIGELGRTGLASDIHLHFEVRPGGPGSAAVDPRPWLGLLAIGRQMTGAAGQPSSVSAPASPAQISSMPGTNVSEQITTERKGQLIMMPPLMPQQQTMPMPSQSSGREEAIPQKMDEQTSLNRLIVQRLLLDLAYT